jgi:HK97 family phage prohead protease
MSRNEILARESAGVRRLVATEPVEFRNSQDGTLTFSGYASVTEYPYEVYGGPEKGGWNETISRGAFKKTLAEGADVNFLLNHDGISMARTKSGTLTLLEDKTGLRAIAELDPENPSVLAIKSAVTRGDLDEMSFGFRVTRDEWFDERGEPSNKMVGTERRISEVNMNKGDVSVVNYGANPATSGGFRDLDIALMHHRAGKPLTDLERDILRDFAAGIDAANIEYSPSEAVVRRLALIDRLTA